MNAKEQSRKRHEARKYKDGRDLFSVRKIKCESKSEHNPRMSARKRRVRRHGTAYRTQKLKNIPVENERPRSGKRRFKDKIGRDVLRSERGERIQTFFARPFKRGEREAHPDGEYSVFAEIRYRLKKAVEKRRRMETLVYKS